MVDERGDCAVRVLPMSAASLRALLANAIDYAGLFPPADLALEPALQNQAAYVRSPDDWMLGAFILPIGKFAEARVHLTQFDQKHPLQISALGPKTENTAAFEEMFAETSDAFFAGHDLIAELGGMPVDLAFIDGMHHFEYALRDFANLERCCTPRSVILIHDCYPLDRLSAERIPNAVFWSGDIWRLIVLLKKYRPDLAVDTIGAPPTGLGMVRNLDPGSRLLQENHGRLCEEFLALDYAYLDQDKSIKLNLFPNDPEKIRTLLGGSSARFR